MIRADLPPVRRHVHERASVPEGDHLAVHAGRAEVDGRGRQRRAHVVGRGDDDQVDLVGADLLADRSAFEDFDADAVGAPGYGFGELDQLAVEHVLGAR